MIICDSYRLICQAWNIYNQQFFTSRKHCSSLIKLNSFPKGYPAAIAQDQVLAQLCGSVLYSTPPAMAAPCRHSHADGHHASAQRFNNATHAGGCWVCSISSKKKQLDVFYGFYGTRSSLQPDIQSYNLEEELKLKITKNKQKLYFFN